MNIVPFPHTGLTGASIPGPILSIITIEMHGPIFDSSFLSYSYICNEFASVSFILIPVPFGGNMYIVHTNMLVEQLVSLGAPIT